MTDLFLEPQDASEAGETPSRRSRRGNHDQKRRQKRRRQRRWITAVVIVAVLAVIGGISWRFLPPLLQAGGEIAKVQDYPGPGTGVVEVTIKEGQTGLDMGATLAAAGVVATQSAFYEAYKANNDSQYIQPGTYRMMKEMRASDAVIGLLNTKNKVATKITVQEGLRASQIYQKIADALKVDVKDVEAAAKDTKGIGLPAEAKGNPEGWYFPDTYEYDSTTTPKALLATMVKQMTTKLDTMGVAQKDRLALLTKASLVEKEVNRAEDRPKAARVIENRLKDDMKLELDSTVSYANGTENLFTTDEERANKSPYNTYQHKGLPPGPIDSPSEASIQAVLAPADGDWLYWCVVNPLTGETVFSNTYAEHQQAVQQLNDWITANPGWDKKK